MKYRVIVESLSYTGNVDDRQVVGEFLSKNWAEEFAEIVRVHLKEAIRHRMVRIDIEKIADEDF